MNKELIDAYSNLNIQDKRNEISNLLIKSEQLLNLLLQNEEIKNLSSVKNYNKTEHKNLSEEEMLTFIYEDLWNIKNKIIALNILKK